MTKITAQILCHIVFLFVCAVIFFSLLAFVWYCSLVLCQLMVTGTKDHLDVSTIYDLVRPM